ncbi:DUF3634 family protein [Oceanisphaera sp. IT1-181]|uniref:DUF3634 family protein n=1 Tax=Oceanisphaera sp. IT1-181 TaxID=3081199 RepID=UPI0029CA5339|nr:DUF3634 family protein [Oceanisphaera sp. IT1-181]
MFSSILLIAVTLFALLYVLRRRQESFRIRLQDAEIKVISGQPPQALLLLCRQLTKDLRTVKGSIRGLKKGEHIVLICSHSIPIAYRRDIYLLWQQQPRAVKTRLSDLPLPLK